MLICLFIVANVALSPFSNVTFLGPVTTAFASGSSCQTVTWTNPGNVNISGNMITKTAGGNGFNAGAVSVEAIGSGNGSIELIADANYIIFGLSNGDADQSYETMDFAWDTYGGTLTVLENGVAKATGLSYTAGDKLKIAVEGGAVKYYRNSTVLYTNNSPSITYPLSADTSIFTSNGSISDLKLCADNIISTLAPTCSTGGKTVTWTNAGNVAISANTITKTAGGNYFNAGAVSVEAIASGDGFVQMTVETTTAEIMFGLSNGDPDQGYNNINFAWDTYGDALSIWENGE